MIAQSNICRQWLEVSKKQVKAAGGGCNSFFRGDSWMNHNTPYPHILLGLYDMYPTTQHLYVSCYVSYYFYIYINIYV